MRGGSLSKEELNWCLYDVGHSAFYTTIVAGFFPVFFKEYWNQGVDASVSTYYLSVVSSLAALVVAVAAPLLGALVDAYGHHRRHLMALTALSGLGCLILASLGAHQTQAAMWLFGGVSVGAALALVIYDALLTQVSTRGRFHQVSLWGYALGYLGGGVLLSLNIAMTLKPSWFGLPDAAAAVKASFVMVALWWLGFSLPLVRGRRCHPARADGSDQLPPPRVAWAGVWRGLMTTMRAIGRRKALLWFLIAYWFYIDGVGTVMRMAVDYGMSLGFAATHLMVALVLVQFVGFPCSLGYIWLAKRWGAMCGLYVGIGLYALMTLGAYFMVTVSHFYLLAVGIALAQGGLQALSRSVFAQLIPPEQSAEFFGFYNTFGKFAAILGPIMLGWVALLTGSNRLAILSILLLFILGALCLTLVRVPASAAASRPSKD